MQIGKRNLKGGGGEEGRGGGEVRQEGMRGGEREARIGNRRGDREWRVW